MLLVLQCNTYIKIYWECQRDRDKRGRAGEIVVLFEFLEDAPVDLVTEVLDADVVVLQHDRGRVVRQLALGLRVADNHTPGTWYSIGNSIPYN